MTLFKIDDGMWAHPKFDGVSDAAVALWTRAGSWSCRYLTDGFVPTGRVPQLRGSEACANELVRAGLWHRLVEDVRDGYVFHDWHDLQDAKDEVETRRRKQRNEKRVQRAEQKRKSAMSAKDSAKDVPADSARESVDESRYGEERKISSDSDSSVAHTSPLRPVPPANELAERRERPRDQSSSQRQSFADLIRAEAFARGIKPAPSLTDNQRRDAIAQVLQYGEDAKLGFEKAAQALIAQAFDDSAVTGDKFCFAIMDATPGKPKAARFKSSNAPVERELSEPTRKALAEADRLRASGKFF